MYCETSGSENVRSAIADSCVPLLCGSRKAVRRAARTLYRLYGVPSYALLVGSSCFPLPFYLRRIPTPCCSPQLLTEIAARFFAGLSPSALPVLIDCTENQVFLRDPMLREELESRCFLSDLARHTEIPPFCYLTPAEGESRAERSD